MNSDETPLDWNAMRFEPLASRRSKVRLVHLGKPAGSRSRLRRCRGSAAD